MYRELRILTARPDEADEATAIHRLYGVLEAQQRGSVAIWLEQAREEIRTVLESGGWPIVVGGSGMYLHTLMHGLSAIPEIDATIRIETVQLHARLGGAAFRAELAKLDPASATKLSDGDTQRLIRAYEVVMSTNRTLGEWQAEPMATPPAHWRFCKFVVEPARNILYANCEKRFDRMIERGAIDEVKALATLNLDPMLPIMKAVGVPELLHLIRGEWTMDMARSKAQQSTRNYAKRQLTFFRHQMSDGLRLEHNLPEKPGESIKFAQQILHISSNLR